ncbi:MAG TPA: proline iminopeptidase-family hydrolase [Sediminibacterium sp.]|nr:proline iminopeptidase-family hydrolase [Sediminibacterium sp.]
MKRTLQFLFAVLLFSCNNTQPTLQEYHAIVDTGVQTGGVRLIPVQTPIGTFKVWTKRFGNNPKIKVLLLHGGPGGTHEFFESFESFFPKEGFEFYEYDQLGSYFSDQPKDSSLWTTDRFVEEVEQVRKALGLNKDNFYLLGHSWGGILAMEYALKYQDHLKGLIISNMMSSCPAYGRYAQDVLSKQLNPVVLDSIRALEARKDFDNPRYMQLLIPNFYNQHFCRVVPWPEALTRALPHINPQVYTIMQGPSEFGISGRLANWDRSKDLPKIKVPTLTIGGMHDTMDPEHMKWMATQVQQGRSLICPEGSHCSMWDDQLHYFPGLISFIHDVDNGRFGR